MNLKKFTHPFDRILLIGHISFAIVVIKELSTDPMKGVKIGFLQHVIVEL